METTYEKSNQSQKVGYFFMKLIDRQEVGEEK